LNTRRASRAALELGIMQAATVLQPLLVLPHLASVLGPHAFGQYLFLLSVATIAATVNDYGFSWTAQRAAAHSRDNPAALARLLAEVLTVKVVLFCGIAALGIALLPFQLPQAPSPVQLLTMLLLPAGSALFPIWYFIGIQRTDIAAVAVTLARLCALILILLLVRSTQDLERAIAIQAGIVLLSAVISIPFFVRGFAIGLRSLELRSLLARVRSSFGAFISSLAIASYTMLPLPLVGIFSGEHAAGQFGIAEKFLIAARALLNVVAHLLMPRAAYLGHRDVGTGFYLLARTLIIVPAAICLSLGIYFMGGPVIELLFGSDFSLSAEITRAVAAVPTLMAITFVAANLFMFNFGYSVEWTRLMTFSSFAFVAMALALQNLFSGVTAVVASILITEAILSVVSMAYFAPALVAWTRSSK
jgi:O-antigen/teichoic acid export membrane protein